MNSGAEITQELLSAWLDGALDAEQASQVEIQLSQSAELQRQLGLMMVNERRLRSEIHRMVAERPLPASLSALLEEPATNEVQTLSQRIRDWLQPAGFGPGLVAASVVTALLVGVFAGNQLETSSGLPSHAMTLTEITIDAGHASFELLERRVAGDPLEIDLKKRDDLFEDAARLVIQHQQGSTSLIQRKLSLGYNRAGRIVDQLEAAGILGPFEGSKARQVLLQDEYSLEQILKELE